MADDNGPDHETAARLRVLHRFIATLEPLNRALLLLYLDERSTREIAEVLGISESNVTTKISRLRQRIRDQIGRAHVCTPVTNAHIVCRLLLEKNKIINTT